MMNFKNEQILLKIIKLTPILFISSILVILTLFIYLEYTNTYKQEKKILETEYIGLNKKYIQQNVDMVYNTIMELQKSTENKLKDSIKERVYEAHTIATRIYNENKDKSKETITKMIKDALVDIRFNNGRGYFYIYSLDFECILFPLNRDIEGTSFYNFQDTKGKYLTRDIISQVKAQDEGFMQWFFYKPNDPKTHYKKIGFNKHFKPLNWFIGTGEYLDDFEKDVKEQALNYIKLLKYPNDNYIFALDFNGTNLYHIKTELIGKNALKQNNNYLINSQNTISQAITIAKERGEGFLTYTQSEKLHTKQAVRKTSYIKAIDNWQWFIGQGFYHDDLYKSLEKKKLILTERFNKYVQNILTFGAILMVILVLISIYISNLIQNRFHNYKNPLSTALKALFRPKL